VYKRAFVKASLQFILTWADNARDNGCLKSFHGVLWKEFPLTLEPIGDPDIENNRRIHKRYKTQLQPIGTDEFLSVGKL
jgi:hypothetical protein